MDINKYIGNKIREFRERKNLTQEEIAEYLNTTAQTISRYEIGDRKTNQDVLFKLAEYFNVSINDFFPPLNNSKEEPTEEQVHKYFEDVLRRKGFLNENDEITQENFDMIMDFVATNKKYLMKNKDK